MIQETLYFQVKGAKFSARYFIKKEQRNAVKYQREGKLE
jgi:hypothetical protein